MDKKGIPPEVASILIIVMIIVAVIALLIGVAIQVFFCLSMSKALSRCKESNRQMQPGLVWLMFIPCFSVVWFYFIAIQVPATLQLEFQDRDQDDGGDYGKAMGLTAAILLSVMVVMSCIPFVNYCSGVVALIYLVFWIIFWVKVAGYSGRLGD
jgi:hypothetical protein